MDSQDLQTRLAEAERKLAGVRRAATKWRHANMDRVRENARRSYANRKVQINARKRLKRLDRRIAEMDGAVPEELAEKRRVLATEIGAFGACTNSHVV